MTAIIPAAGKGARMQALTGGLPKELLPLSGKTVLGRIVEEAQTVAERVIVVSAPDKPEIETWADENDVELVYQYERHGFADAVACADVEDDVVVLLGDCPYHGGSPLERMTNIVLRGIDGCIAVEEVSEEAMSRYGITEVNDWGGITNILEKPKPDQTASRWAVAARYAFSIRTMAQIQRVVAEQKAARPGQEVGLTEVIVTLIKEGAGFKAAALQDGQRRADCGTPSEYEAAQRLRWN